MPFLTPQQTATSRTTRLNLPWVKTLGLLVTFLALSLIGLVFVSMPTKAAPLTEKLDPVQIHSNSSASKPRLANGPDGAVDPTFQSGFGANATIYAVTVQSDGKILVGGDFTIYGNTPAHSIARLNSNGTLDTSFNLGVGANYTVYAIAVQNDGKIIIGGSFTSYNNLNTNYIARLNPDGSLDTAFNPSGSGFDNFFSNRVYAVAIQSDGKILVAGIFNTYNGNPTKSIVRLNPDGSLDTTFNIGGSGVNGIITALVLQFDNKILIGGDFSTYNGNPAKGIARLNPDGSLDTTFNIGGSGADNWVFAIAIQNDGKIVIGGFFTNYNGTTAYSVARLNSTGSLDNTFNVGGNVGSTGPNRIVRTLAIQSNGKILVGGQFTSNNGATANYFTQLNSDGSLDTSFNNGNSGFNGDVYTVAVQTDNKILIGGFFTTYNGAIANHIIRVNPDGSFDATFNPGGANNYVSALTIQNDGKILIGGNFTTYNGITVNHIARLNSDGTLDTTFNSGGSGANDIVYAVVIQPDGKILIGGKFTTYNGVTTPYLARLNSNGILDTTFNPGGSGPGGDCSNTICSIFALALDSHGNILVGGAFANYNGNSAVGITRLNPDGTFDSTFNPGGAGVNGAVFALTLDRDDKILLGGRFFGYNGIQANYLARLNPDGSFDTTFNVAGTGANSSINAIAVDSSGKILLAGQFTSYNSTTTNHLTRLNPDGTIDNSFNFNASSANDNVYTLALQNDGKIVIGGFFTNYNGAIANHIARLNSDGNLDSTFNPGSGANQSVFTLALQNDGKIIIGGSFTSVGNYPRDYVARLYNTVKPASSISVNSSPNPAIVGSSVTFTATLQPVTATGSVVFTFNTGSSSNSITSTITNGTATYATSNLPVGTTIVTATYSGDNFVAGSISSTYSQTITAGAPAKITIVSGGGQSAIVNTTFAQPLVGYVTDNANNAVSGAVVTFTISNFGPSATFGGGTTDYIATTDISGLVTSTVLTANNHAGIYAGIALVGVSVSANFTLTNLASSPSQISAMSGSGQSAVVSTTFAQPLVVRVADSGNNPVSGAVVTFTAPSGGTSGVFAGGSAVYTGATDVSGLVTSTTFTANSVTGNYTVTATVGGVNGAASFSLTNLAACDPFLVTSKLDDGSCGTLRQALVAASTGQTKIVTINLAAGSVISLTTGLTLTSDVVVTTTAPCGTGPNNTMLPPVILQGVGPNSGNGLTLAGTNRLYNLWVRGFSGVQIKAPAGSSTRMQCVKVSKN